MPTIPPEELAKQEAAKAAQHAYAMVERLAADVGARYSPDRVRLDNFEIYDARQRAVLERVRACADSLKEIIADGRGLIFFGTVGTGKDHLLIASLYEAARLGFACRYFNGQELYGTFRDRMDTGQKEDSLLKELEKPDVLAINDPIPPVGAPTSWNVHQMYRLVHRRYSNLKSTWLSMNAVSIEDMDEMLSAPVFDRICESAELFACNWPSNRRRVKSA
jgi:DNA replication protein DnaC